MALALSQVVIWELDEDTRQVRWCRDEQALFARPVTYEIITSDDLGLVHTDDRAAVAACWREHETGGAARCEYRVNRPDGTLVWVASSREIVLDASGRRTGLIGVLVNSHANLSPLSL
jgi:PAS domain-containing protein